MNCRSFGLLCLALLTGCQGKNRPPADAYRHLIDKITVVSGTDGLLRHVCSRKSKSGEWEGISAANCYTFGSPQRWRGTWTIGFETNYFARHKRSVSVRMPPDQFLLSGDVLPWQELHCGMGKDACRFHVEFVGRQSRYPVRLDQYVIAVDKMLAMQPRYAVRHPKKPKIWIEPGGEDGPQAEAQTGNR